MFVIVQILGLGFFFLALSTKMRNAKSGIMCFYFVIPKKHPASGTRGDPMINSVAAKQYHPKTKCGISADSKEPTWEIDCWWCFLNEGRSLRLEGIQVSGIHRGPRNLSPTGTGACLYMYLFFFIIVPWFDSFGWVSSGSGALPARP